MSMLQKRTTIGSKQFPSIVHDQTTNVVADGQFASRAGKSTARTPSPSYGNHPICIYIVGLEHFVGVK